MAEPGMIYTSRSGVNSKDENGMRFRVDGSKPVSRDLSSLFNDFGLRKVRDNLIPLDAKGRAKVWCSYPYHEGYTENGEDDKGWRSTDEFSTYTDRHGKKRKREHCDTCRAKAERRRRALMAEAEGKTLRDWQRRTAG